MEVITSHTNADFDTLASMIAAKKLYPEARLVLPGSMEKGLRDCLPGLDLQLTIEKIGDIDLDSITRLILVDVRESGRIGGFAEVAARGVEVHIYDHHPPARSDIRGSKEVTEEVGSTTTILALILMQKRIKLTAIEATVMMAGIYEDTGSLTFSSTTVKDYEAAAFLLVSGALLTRVSELLKSELTTEEVLKLNELLISVTTYSVGGTDVTVAAGSVENYSGEAALLAHRLIDMGHFKTLFLLADSGDRVHVVARSSAKEVNVGKVMARLGGGGHPSAASTTIKGVTLIEAREKLITAIEECVLPIERAAEIMSAPPLTVTATTSVKDAGVVMLRYNINALPVVSKGKVLGVITRQIVLKADYHGLSGSRASDYMSTEIEVVSPSATLDDIREAIFAHSQRLLPVVDDEKIVGVVTRTDILKLLKDEFYEKSGPADIPEDKYKKKRTRHLDGLMRERLPEWVVKFLEEAGRTADKLGFKAYVVGGIVRDLVLRRENLDIDIVVEGDGIEFARALAHRYNKKYKNKRQLKTRSHARFKTAVIIFPNGFQIDVATARLEYYEKPGALPTVEMSSLKLDLFRRDFTINTLAIELNPGGFGTLIDYFGALADIKSKNVRVIHNLSFIEDPTRVLRAVRFSERFGFMIAKQTRGLIKNSVKLDIFSKTSGARLFDELKNILEEDIAAPALKSLKDFGVLKLIEPDIVWDKRMAALFKRAGETLAWYRLSYTDEDIRVWLVLFFALTDPLTDAKLKRLCKRLSIQGKVLDIISKKREGLKALGQIAKPAEAKALSNSKLYHLLTPLPTEVVLYLMERTESEKTRRAFSDHITKLRDTRCELKGNELKRLGVKEGPAMGRLLRDMLDKRLDNEIGSREDEVEFVKVVLADGKKPVKSAAKKPKKNTGKKPVKNANKKTTKKPVKKSAKKKG